MIKQYENAENKLKLSTADLQRISVPANVGLRLHISREGKRKENGGKL